jgi:starvation-inducible DNA-binding protein
MKKKLAEMLSVLLADTVNYRALAHGYHWNVKGPEFHQFHEIFRDLYEDADSAVDPLAENIRKLGYDAPFTLGDFISLSDLDTNPVTNGDPIAMTSSLYQINCDIREKLDATFKCANDCNEQGIADFLAGRIDLHAKWIWQLGTVVGADKTSVSILNFEE